MIETVYLRCFMVDASILLHYMRVNSYQFLSVSVSLSFFCWMTMASEYVLPTYYAVVLYLM
jgi:hypothetical protein